MRRVLVLGALALACGLLSGAPEASATERWRLEFKHERPQKIVYVAPTGEAEAFWYVLYTLKNPCKAAVKTRVDIRVLSDEKHRYTGAPQAYRDSLQPLVEEMIEKRMKRPFLNLLEIPRTEIPPGETVECVAIFSLHEMEDLRTLFQAMDAFRVRDHKRGQDLLKDCLARHPEGDASAVAMELQKAAEAGIDEARTKTEEISERWVKRRKELLATGEAEAPPGPPDLKLLGDAVHALRIRDWQAGVEALEKMLSEHPESRFRRQADLLKTLALTRRVHDLDREITDYLASTKETLRASADRLEFHVSGLYDVVCPDGDKVYAETRVLKIVYDRTGDEFLPDLDGYKKTSETWYVEEGERRLTRKVHEPRGTPAGG